MALGSTTRVKDSGSNYQGFADEAPKANPPRSVFDLSYLHTTTCNEGMLVPVGIWEVLPDSDYDFDVQALIRVQPLEVPVMSRLRAFFHTYFLPYADLWKHWKSFYSKGHSRTYTNVLPRLMPDAATTTNNARLYLSGVEPVPGYTSGFERIANDHLTLLDYIFNTGTIKRTSVTGTSGNVEYYNTSVYLQTGFNLLIPFAYQHIFRDYYLPANIYRNNTEWFPDDPHDFILNDYDEDDTYHTVTPSGLKCEDLFVLRYRNWTDDYFTSATTTPVYGDEPSLTLTGASRILPVDTFYPSEHPYLPSPDGAYHSVGIGARNGVAGINTAWDNNITFMANRVLGVDLSGQPIGSFTVEQLRVLAVNQLAIEKMTRTDGSYREFVRAFFGDYPKSDTDTRAQYIGGTYQPIVVSEVLQTSESSQQSPLGESAGHAVSASSGNIGHLHTTEYGVVMTIMSIMPDTIYYQGQERWFAEDLTQEDYFLSGREQLGPQYIRNRELFNELPSSLKSQFTSNPDGIFGYQGRFDHYRYRQNRISGWIADPSWVNYFSYTQARSFSNYPTLTDSFLSTKGTIRAEMFTSPAEPHFIVQVANQCRAVQPLPYKAIPANILN